MAGTQEDQGDSQPDREDVKGNQGKNRFYVWVSLIKAVSHLTLLDFDKALNLSALEFFAYASFVIYEQEREKKMIEDFRRGIKH